MRSRALATTCIAGAAGLTLALTAPLSASAHVELDASATTPATLSVLTFAVGHGCAGSATTSLAIDFPAGVQAITPTIAPGWTITETNDDTGSTVTYTADVPLPDGYRDTVQVSALLPVDGEPGDVVAFPTLQTCEVGSTAWDELPTDGVEPSSPAPALTLTAAEPATDTSAADVSDTTDVVAAAADAPVDSLARGLGLASLVVGVVAVLLLTVALRRRGGDAR
ncbi:MULTISPECIES: YcnI family protein [unclassified Frigoribacterium]|uniref:YcnI family copper-binding membrane protein n=1 Tax=unclassified Frigoribacterium TaxID=2627005 RepID=UPI000700949E|nr:MULTISPECIES: YcnI family protein [unclassified Frigoribacterium]KQO46324.1 sortase [Frigoribacterium sp. Leaf254]KQT38417.1 sortase [Frigoribacterium sp. Leaf415]